MSSLSDTQVTMLRLAKRHLVLPGRDDDARNDLALLVNLKLVEVHDTGFRVTPQGLTILTRLDAIRQ